MSRGSGEGDSAAGGMRLGGEVTGRVQVGHFVLEVGSPAGMRAEFAAGQAAESSALRVALSQPESPGALASVEEAVEDAESVTGKVERAFELFTALAQGKILDRTAFLKEVDVLLGALERLDREGRHRDALRLARALAALLALATRWIALVESLHLALRSARALGHAPGIAWARHELGTLFLGADDAAAANSELRESLRIREEIGDKAGAEVTRHNLTALGQAFGSNGGRGTWARPALFAASVAGALLLTAGGLGAALAVLGGDGPPPADTTAPTVNITQTPEDPTEEEAGEGPVAVIVDGPDEVTDQTEATFTIEAPGATRLECSLDGRDPEGCTLLAVFPVDEGEHTLVVRGFAGDTAGPQSDAYRWTVDTTPPRDTGSVE